MHVRTRRGRHCPVADTIPGRINTVDAGGEEDAAPQTRLEGAEPEVLRSIFVHAEPGERPGEAVGKIASSRIFIPQETEISALAAAMDKDPGIFAVGVVDGEGAPLGLVLRRELFDLLGKPYGREYYKKKPVSMVMKNARVFRDDHSILGVADSLPGEMRGPTSTHYLLADMAGRFSGVFSTKDLLIYLSDITGRDIALTQEAPGSNRERELVSFRGADRHPRLLGNGE